MKKILSEVERCKDPHYFYLNYYLVNGNKPRIREIDKQIFKEYEGRIDKTGK